MKYSAYLNSPLPLVTAAVRDLRRDRARAPGGTNYQSLIKALVPIACRSASLLVPENPECACPIAASALHSFGLRWRQLPRRTLVATYVLRTVWLLAGRERRRLKLPAPSVSSSAGVQQLLLRELHRMGPGRVDALVLRDILQQTDGAIRRTLRFSEKKTARVLAGASAKLAERLSKQGIQDTPQALLTISTALPAPELERCVLDQLEAWSVKPEKSELVRAALRAWTWIGIKRRLRQAFTTLGITCGVLLVLGLTMAWLAKQGYLTALFFQHMNGQLLKEFPQLAIPARPFPGPGHKQSTAALTPKTSADLYVLTNIWTCELSLTAQSWKQLQPTRIPPVQNMNGPDGMTLRNPKAQRSGLAGVLGIEFNWTEAALKFADQSFSLVAVRYRGNGTYINSLYGPKQSLKIDLNKFVKTQDLAGIHTLNLVNAIPDFTYLHDALAEQLFRDLGVPGPRTGYAYVTVHVPGKFEHQPLGLYVLIENIDSDFAADRFGSKKVPIFKPVTPQLFQDLGNDWTDYAPIYDLKTKATPEQQQRLIQFAHLVSRADDAEFARRLAEFLDLDEFARFLAGHVLLASYDGFLANGQNYYLYLDPRSNRFGFIPWDQDHSWGEFGYVATADERERASIWEPSTYHYRFLERVLRVESFRAKYRQVLEKALAELFRPERLARQIDTVGAVIRPAIAAESEFRLQRFDLALSTNWLAGPRDGAPEGPKAPVHQIKRFIANRSQSIRDQLDEKTTGVVLNRHHRPP